MSVIKGIEYFPPGKEIRFSLDSLAFHKRANRKCLCWSGVDAGDCTTPKEFGGNLEQSFYGLYKLCFVKKCTTRYSVEALSLSRLFFHLCS